MVIFTPSKIVGSSAESSWSQAQTATLLGGQQLLVVLGLRCSGESSLVDLTTIGAQILSEIEARANTKETQETLEEMIGSVIAGSAEEIEIDIVVAVQDDLQIVLYGKGAVVAYLLRGEKLASLQQDWGQGTSLSGVVMAGDVLFLATRQLVTEIGTSTIKEILKSSESPAELLAPLVHTQADSSAMAAIVGEVGEAVVSSPRRWWQLLPGRGTTPIHVKNREPRKMNLWVGMAILLLLIVMIGVGMVKRRGIVAARTYTNLETSVNQKISETLSISDLNPERARQLLGQAKGEVEAYLATDVREEYQEKAQELDKMIDITEEKAFKKNTVQLSTIVELPILVEGLKATRMRSDGRGNLVFLDTATARIVSMNLVDRSRVVVATEESGAFVDLGVAETSIYGLNEQGVEEIVLKTESVKRVIEPDEFWQEPTLLGLFAGNIYILDRGQGEVWKYPTLGGGEFGGRRRWFAVGIQPDLANVVDMKVSGDIWLLTSTGKLERYSRGAPVTFSMEGFPAKGEAKKFIEPVAVFATESYIYVLERGAGRVVKFGDDGKYVSQYANEAFGKASDLVVVDDMAYVLVENTVKAFGL